MRIFITQKQFNDKYSQLNDGLEARYIEYFLEKKIFPPSAVFIPIVNHLAHCQTLVNTIAPDFVIFTGSNDVMPLSNEPIEGNFSPKRDEVERWLIQYCDQHHVPKLAICRGFQFLNVHYGGSLDYTLLHHPIENKHHSCLFESQESQVNSYHQHGVHLKDLASTFKMLAVSKPDDLVEAVMHASCDISPTLGVQWHPERANFSSDLFELLFKKVMYESGVISGRYW